MAAPMFSTFVVTITALLMGLGCFSSSSLLLALPISTIASSPAFLPISPLSSPPTLPPDITPLFPTPGGDHGPSPSQPPSIPTIPSSPSPPNPDQMGFAPGLSMGFAPSEPTPGPSSVAVAPSGSLDSILFLGLMVFWLLLQLSGL
ncbi:hypothetical protein RHSIM_Rhsim13G0017000 [Rhododendron simsii]|uniref:Classical arabinogalactan protein 26 n=1 Tax=Rhododendron simsii TaxID=118357 RepID=A0A834L6E8_RHOSS|nr:hypothetical protein RHSIM_Rhsim13G0017000 [Rhododendron simsii]